MNASIPTYQDWGMHNAPVGVPCRFSNSPFRWDVLECRLNARGRTTVSRIELEDGSRWSWMGERRRWVAVNTKEER